jgi:hypothetical protein
MRARGPKCIAKSAALLAAIRAARPELLAVACCVVLALTMCVASRRSPECLGAPLPLIVLLAGTQYLHRSAPTWLAEKADTRILIQRALHALVTTVILAAAITGKQDFRGWGAMDGVTMRHPAAGSALSRIA